MTDPEQVPQADGAGRVLGKVQWQLMTPEQRDQAYLEADEVYGPPEARCARPGCGHLRAAHSGLGSGPCDDGGRDGCGCGAFLREAVARSAAAVRMDVVWPSNTATPPSGWERLIDADGAQPASWFITPGGAGERLIVTGCPSWADFPRPLAPEDRVTAEDYEYHFLDQSFALVYHLYRIPDVDVSAGPATHTFVNLQFTDVGPAPFDLLDAPDDEIGMSRVLSGAKPAYTGGDITDEVAELWTAATRDAGLGTVRFNEYGFRKLWVAPPRLADRVDRDALTAAWHVLADADPHQGRAATLLRAVEIGLADAFSLDLLPRDLSEDGTPHPWWDEGTAVGLVVLGAVLGYPPASTYAILSSEFDKSFTGAPRLLRTDMGMGTRRPQTGRKPNRGRKKGGGRRR